MSNGTAISISLPACSAGKRGVLVSIAHPLGDAAFNQSISLGKHGYKYTDLSGSTHKVVPAKDEEGILFAGAPKDGRVRSVKLTYVPIKIREGLHTEVKILSLAASTTAIRVQAPEPGPEPSARQDNAIDQHRLDRAFSEIKSSLRSEISFVYFIKPEMHQVVKIGVSQDPDARVGQLSTGAFGKINIIGVISGTPRLEKALHRVFEDQRLNGEWFKYDATIEALIRALPKFEGPSRSNGIHSDLSRDDRNHSCPEILIDEIRSLIPRA